MVAAKHQYYFILTLCTLKLKKFSEKPFALEYEIRNEDYLMKESRSKYIKFFSS